MKLRITRTNEYHKTITITLYTAKEMLDYSTITHDHTEYDTEWDDLLYTLHEYQGIDSHVSKEIVNDQLECGFVVCAIVMYSKDAKKLEYIEQQITQYLLNVLSETYPWDPTGKMLKDIENESDQSKADDLINQYE